MTKLYLTSMITLWTVNRFEKHILQIRNIDSLLPWLLGQSAYCQSSKCPPLWPLRRNKSIKLNETHVLFLLIWSQTTQWNTNNTRQSTVSLSVLVHQKWVSSFLTAHQHIIGYSVPYNGLENAIKDGKYNQGYLAMIKYE